MVCWWLVHQNSMRDRDPLGKAIAIGYSFFGMMVLASFLLRSYLYYEEMLQWSQLLSRVYLTAALGLEARRVYMTRGRHYGR